MTPTRNAAIADAFSPGATRPHRVAERPELGLPRTYGARSCALQSSSRRHHSAHIMEASVPPWGPLCTRPPPSPQ